MFFSFIDNQTFENSIDVEFGAEREDREPFGYIKKDENGLVYFTDVYETIKVTTTDIHNLLIEMQEFQEKDKL